MIRIGTVKTFEYISQQANLPRRARYRIHVIVGHETACQMPVSGWDTMDVLSLDGIEWLCKNCVLALEKRERDKVARGAERARLAAMPEQLEMFKS